MNDMSPSDGGAQPLESFELRARQQQSIADFARHALGEHDAASLRAHACMTVAAGLGIDYAVVLEGGRGSGAMLVEATFGMQGGDFTGELIACPEGCFALTTTSAREAGVIDDAATEQLLGLPPFANEGGRSAISVGIRSGGVVSVLLAVSRTSRSFTPDERLFVSSAASILGAGVERIRAEEALREANERLDRESRDRARVAAELRENNRKLEFFFDALPVGVSVVDAQRNVLKMNAALSRILRLSPDSLLAGEWRKRNTVAADGSPMPHGAFATARVLNGETDVADVETGIITEDGETIWTSVSAVATPFDDWRVLAVTTDITERKRAEQALRKSEERFRQYFNLGLVGIVITSPEKGWVEVSDHLCRMLGYEREELLRTTWAALTHPEDLAADTKQFEEMLGGLREGYVLEKRFIRKDGGTVHTMISVRCIRRADGSIDYIIGVLLDITRRKQAEEALAASEQRLRELSRRLVEIQEAERRRIARELHDEVGQTLTAVKIAVHGIECHGEVECERRRQAIATIDSALQHVRDLSMLLRPAMLDELGLAPTLRWYFDSMMKNSGIAYECRIRGAEQRLSPDVEITCFRVAQEAVTNAIRHAAASSLLVDLNVTPTDVELSVVDDGVGMDPDLRRGAGVATTGLSAMKERVQLIGGSLSITSRKGQGTTIRVRLPNGGS